MCGINEQCLKVGNYRGFSWTHSRVNIYTSFTHWCHSQLSCCRRWACSFVLCRRCANSASIWSESRVWSSSSNELMSTIYNRQIIVSWEIICMFSSCSTGLCFLQVTSRISSEIVFLICLIDKSDDMAQRHLFLTFSRRHSTRLWM